MLDLPPVRLVVRVGVSGHRDPDLPVLLPRVREVLGRVRQAAERLAADWLPGAVVRRGSGGPRGDGGPALRLVSPLAEGTDQIAAEAALDPALGFHLQCPLPTSVEEYVTTFEGRGAEERFRALLARASAVLELPGRLGPGARPWERHEAYRNVGEVVLEHSDVLLAVWDPSREPRPGGTAGVVEAALRRGLPVVWLPPTGPEEAGLVAMTGEEFAALLERPPAERRVATKALDLLEGALAASVALSPVEGEGGRHSLDLLGDFLAEPAGAPRLGLRFGRLWTEGAWKRLPAAPAPGPVPAAPPHPRFRPILETYERFRRPISARAQYYAALHRTTFLALAALGAVAVAFATLIWAARRPPLPHVFTALELATILAMLFLYHQARRRRWRERAVDYRLLAERLRHAAELALLGRTGPVFRSVGPQYGPMEPGASWSERVYRAIARIPGLVPEDDAAVARLRLDGPYLEACRDRIRGPWLGGQIRYHRDNAARSDRLHRVLEAGAGTVLGLTVLVCLLHFVVHAIPLNVLAVLLPAIGASLHSIASQAELHRVAERSRAMEGKLGSLAAGVAATRADGHALAAAAAEAAEVMLAEVGEWRVLFQLRPLDPPH